VSDGNFRDDLFYRLNVIPIDLPPLRQRLEDIPLLIDHFLNKFCQKIGLPTKSLSEKAGQMLLSYSWPGNVRELENLIERAVVISKNQDLKISDFPPEIAAGIPALGKASMDVGMSIGEAEKILILKTLKAHGGNKSKAADVLGISARTLRNKLQEYGLSGSQ